MFLNITLTVRFFASGSTNESGGKWLALSALLLSIFFFSCFAKGNIGPLALLLPTYVLIPSWGDKLFESSALTSSDSFRVLPEKMKDFLSVLVAALHKLPEDKVQKLYLMKNSPQQNFWSEI